MNATKANNFPNTEAPVRTLRVGWLKLETFSALSTDRRRKGEWGVLRWMPITHQETRDPQRCVLEPKRKPSSGSCCLRIIAHVLNYSLCVNSPKTFRRLQERKGTQLHSA